MEGLTTNQYQLTGLEEDSQHWVQVQYADIDGKGTPGSWTTSLTFKTPEQYPRPTNVKAKAITASTATISWTDNMDAASYIIYYYAPATETEWSQQAEATRNPFTLTDLEIATDYKVAVVAIDQDGNKSRQSNVISFTTRNPNPAITDLAASPGSRSATITWQGQSDRYEVSYRKANYLLREDFEGGALPEGWRVIDLDGDGYNWTASDFTASHSGIGILYSESYSNSDESPLTPDNWLITPKVTLRGEMQAWLRAQDANWPYEHFAFYVSTKGNSPLDFQQASPEYVATGEYQPYTLDLSSYGGAEGYIAIRHFNCTDQFRLNLDDFSIIDGEWQTLPQTEQSQLTIDGLEQGTEYEVRVRGIVDGYDDVTATTFFTTLSSTRAPWDVAVIPGRNTASVSWEGESEAYTVSYQKWDDFYEDFESDLSNWTTLFNGAGPIDCTTAWQQNSISHKSGSHSVVTFSDDYHGGYTVDNWLVDTWLISPKVRMNGTLSFFVRCSNEKYSDDFMVRLSTTTNSVDGFTTVLESGTAPYEWTKVEIDLSEYYGEVGYIAICHMANGKGDLYIDDIRINDGAWEQTNPSQSVYTDGNSAVLSGLDEDATYSLNIYALKGGYTEAISDQIWFRTLSGDPIDITFKTDENNEDAIKDNDGKYANVTIEGLTLRSDGQWKSLCLPFDLVVPGSVLDGADVRTVESYSLRTESGTVLLNCITPLTRITANQPFLIRRTEGSDITDPVFPGVTIKNGDPNDEDAIWLSKYDIKFGAVYYPFLRTEGYRPFYHVDGSRFLSNGEHQYYAFDGYFYFNETIRNKYSTFVINAGEDDILTGVELTPEGQDDQPIYNLAGQRLGRMQKGVNIVGGKKVLVK